MNLTEELNRQKTLMGVNANFDDSLYQNKRTITINGVDYDFSQLKYSESNVFIIELEGREIGRATLSKDGSYLENIRISDQYRRKGLASKLYEYIEYITNKKLKPSPVKQSPEIMKFWDKRKLNEKTLMNIQEDVDHGYSLWKRRNVTVRGIKELGSYNDVYASYGLGLYTAPLSNKSMAKGYGKIYFVVNAIPKHPKIVNSVNEAELWEQKLINDYCKQHGKEYNRYWFESQTAMEKEMIKLGYDGLIIKGREMVNYTPENIRYFENENQLYQYYQTIASQP